MGAPVVLRIAARFCGPPSSGNGGYTAGLVAAHLPGEDRPTRVTLRRPPPLDVEMTVRGGDAGVYLEHAGEVVAEAQPHQFVTEAPTAVDLETARRAESAYAGHHDHPFPTCFVCGPDRADGDGLRLAPGHAAPGVTACVWTPQPGFSGCGPTETAQELIWAALDCPGGWSSGLQTRPLVLGQLTAQVMAPAPVGMPLVVVGQLLRTEGRKTWTASAMYDAGVLVGRAEHLWIAVDPADFG